MLAADIAGYSRLMQQNEAATVRDLKAHQALVFPIIAEYGGSVVDTAGDGILAEFPSAVGAVEGAVAIQQGLARHNRDVADDRRMLLRIGVNLGDIIHDRTRIYGDGVNIAARLESLAEPGGICLSADIYSQVRDKLPYPFSDLGEQFVKNISRPLQIYSLGAGQIANLPRRSPDSPTVPRRLWRLRSAVLMAGAVVLVAGALLAWQYGAPFNQANAPASTAQGTGAPAQCVHASIAVLPFANLSGDAKLDYFSEGITEDIITALGRFADLSVTARVAVQQYAGKSVQPNQLFRELGVCYALEGSARKEGDKTQVTARLLDATSGRLLWSDNYDGTLQDVFAMRNRITEGVVGRLAVKLQEVEKKRAFKKPTESLDAYDYVLRGRDFYARGTRSANIEARGMFERAIELDPAYASAYAALGYTRLAAANLGWTEFRDEALQQAESMARKATGLDSDNAEAHRLLGEIYLDREQFDLAISEHDRAIALNPNEADSYDARGSLFVYAGSPKAALESIEIAKRLNPNAGPARLESIGWANYLQGRYEDAVKAFTECVGMNATYYSARAGLAASYAQLGRNEEAANAAHDLRRIWPFFAVDTFVSPFKGSKAGNELIVSGLRKAGLQ